MWRRVCVDVYLLAHTWVKPSSCREETNCCTRLDGLNHSCFVVKRPTHPVVSIPSPRHHHLHVFPGAERVNSHLTNCKNLFWSVDQTALTGDFHLKSQAINQRTENVFTILKTVESFIEFQLLKMWRFAAFMLASDCWSDMSALPPRTCNFSLSLFTD